MPLKQESSFARRPLAWLSLLTSWNAQSWKTSGARTRIGQNWTRIGQVKSIREGVETTLASTRKNINILPRVGQDEAALNRAIQLWVESAADFGDANLVATAKSAGIANILSDDADLISFEGIVVYTANQTAIGAAQASGKLIL